MRGVDDEYAEAVLNVVERIPPGRVMSYGAIAELVRDELGRGGPRQVGAVMSAVGGAVTWWRVVGAAGRVPRHHEARALRELAAEGTPMMAGGRQVDMRLAMWPPDGT